MRAMVKEKYKNENIRERKTNKYPICISVIFQLAMFFLNMAQQLKLFTYKMYLGNLICDVMI